MIIAIDESGDFATYSGRFNYFVAVLISERGDALATKQAQFETWKNTITPEKFDDHNEVKGTELTEEELLRFTKDVLLADPAIFSFTVRIVPNENKEVLQDKFQAIELEVIDKSIAHFEETGQAERAAFYKKFRKWYEKRNFQHYMKLGMLQKVIAKSVNEAIGTSIVEWATTGSDENLMKIYIMIDEDFVTSAAERGYFDELLAQAVRHATATQPIPAIKEMTEPGHPFTEKYKIKGDRIDLTHLLGDKLAFRPSNQNWPLQIADIYSTILNRVENKETCKDSWELINKAFKRQNRTHFKMNPDPDTETRIVIE